MAADYKTPQWLLPNELNMSLNPALSESRHSLYSMDFDGSNDEIVTSFLGTGQTEITISAWINSNSIGADQTIFGTVWAASTACVFDVDSTGKLRLFFRSGSNPNPGFLVANTTLSADTWYHVAVTLSPNGSNMDCTFYLNGSIDNTTGAAQAYGQGTTAIASSGTGYNIGSTAIYVGSNYNFFNGKIDEVAIFNRSLSSAEITTIYNSGVPANLMASSTKPIAYYPLGEEAQMGYSNWNFPNGSLQSRTIEFDGTGYISVTPTPFTDFTVSFWINPSTTASATYDGILGSGTVSAQGGILRYVAYDGSASVGNVLLYLGGAWIGVAALTNGEWSNVILTYDSTADEFKSYKNGTLDTTISSPDFSGQSTDAHSFVDIGRRNGTAGTIFNGKISNVALWNSSQVSNVDNIYNNGAPQSTYTVTPNNWWKLNTDDSTYDTATSTWTFTDGPGTNDGTSTTLPSTALVPSDLQFESPYSNYSLNFDGVDDYIETSGPNITSGGFSFSAWVKTSDTVNNQVIWNGIDSTTAKSFVRITGTALRVKIIDGSGGSNNIDNTVTTADGNWHHIAFTTDGLTTTNGDCLCRWAGVSS